MYDKSVKEIQAAEEDLGAKQVILNLAHETFEKRLCAIQGEIGTIAYELLLQAQVRDQPIKERIQRFVKEAMHEACAKHGFPDIALDECYFTDLDIGPEGELTNSWQKLTQVKREEKASAQRRLRQAAGFDEYGLQGPGKYWTEMVAPRIDTNILTRQAFMHTMLPQIEDNPSGSAQTAYTGEVLEEMDVNSGVVDQNDPQFVPGYNP